MNVNQRPEIATFAGGCFWCTEAIFKRLKGVEKVVSGYTGGHPSADGDQPNYEQVSSGSSGHAEAIQIKFDPNIISYEKLLDVYWHLHDPTTLNRQGADVGEQYRSVIFYHNDEQKKVAEESKRQLELSKYYKEPIVTKIEPLQNFYLAEDHHQNYYEKNSDQAYCKIVIDPKIQKLMLKYSQEVK